MDLCTPFWDNKSTSCRSCCCGFFIFPFPYSYVILGLSGNLSGGNPWPVTFSGEATHAPMTTVLRPLTSYAFHTSLTRSTQNERIRLWLYAVFVPVCYTINRIPYWLRAVENGGHIPQKGVLSYTATKTSKLACCCPAVAHCCILAR
jgi:hypothetical protein